MKLLILGRSGQLARALARLLENDSLFEVTQMGRPNLDLGDFPALRRCILEIEPAIIVNAAAYTAVDKAEGEPQEAFRINGEALGVIGDAAAEIGCPVIHVSTDYVFDGREQRPYRPEDPTNPQTVYGASKLAGERALAVAQPQHVIVRTAWLYGAGGGNFVDTMLRLGATRERLAVVDDQRGCPTVVDDLANVIVAVARHLTSSKLPNWGVFHYCGAGEITWCRFARAIFEEGARYGRKVPLVEPTTTAAFKAKAPRPSYSVLDCSGLSEAYGICQREWRQGLRDVISQKLSKTSQQHREL
jgi:dTDP-4-dehydrorhamnose reductase